MGPFDQVKFYLKVQCIKHQPEQQKWVWLSSTSITHITLGNQTTFWHMIENHLYTGKATGLGILSLALSNN